MQKSQCAFLQVRIHTTVKQTWKKTAAASKLEVIQQSPFNMSIFHFGYFRSEQ